MKETLARASRGLDVQIEEIDISTDEDLSRRYAKEMPVLFIGGRKAFKYRATEEELRKRLLRG